MKSGLLKSGLACLLAACFLWPAGGCRRFEKRKPEMVYLWMRDVYLRDRVAAVSNQTGEVKNGEAMEVVAHGRRFLKVKTAGGQVGWLPERAVIDAKTYGQFEKLAGENNSDWVVAEGTLRDEMYLHDKPGRETDRLYLLRANAKVAMLKRATVPRYSGEEARRIEAMKPAKKALPGEAARPEQEMEDWWLVRDKNGHTGWMLGSHVDADVSYTVGQYAEGQRIAGNYRIATVHDADAPERPADEPEYVMALSQLKQGLPYDFDQIRVFTWSLRHHRYETAFRLRGIEGYFPIKITSEPGKAGGTEPVFTFTIAGSPTVAVNTETGIALPAHPRTIAFALRDTLVKRVGADMEPIPTMRDETEKKPERKKRRR
ncbi:MAG: SH3 domain-containing protein [Terracidiphilus sp.]